MGRTTSILVVLLLSLLATRALAADADAPLKDDLGRDYFVYAPPRIDPKKTYWLAVGVHGYGGDGRGAAGLSAWARRGDCVVVGPSFPNNGYQLLRERADEQLVSLFDRLKKQYPLHPKLFVYGFSGGAQFAHRFMMKHPELVAGCSAHSAGSWATGEGWGDVNPAAAGIPFVMSCGEADTAKMADGAPFGRLEWAKAFERKAADAGLCFEARYWPKVGHAFSPGVTAMTDECYRLATVLAPAHEKQLAAIRELAKAGKPEAAKAALARATKAVPKPAKGLGKAWAEKQAKDLAALAKEIDASLGP